MIQFQFNSQIAVRTYIVLKFGILGWPFDEVFISQVMKNHNST